MCKDLSSKKYTTARKEALKSNLLQRKIKAPHHQIAQQNKNFTTAFPTSSTNNKIVASC